MDETTRARINLNAVLRALEHLPGLDEQTAKLVSGARQTIQFRAPAATVRLVIGGGSIGHYQGPGPASIALLFPRPKHLNRMFEGEGKPIPVKGFTRLGYLTSTFSAITDRLTHFLKPTPELLADPGYRAANTILTLHLALYALGEIGNSDSIGRELAAQLADGEVLVAVAGGPALTVAVRGHRLRVTPQSSRSWRAKMVFADLETAGAVLRGELASFTAIGRGKLELGGYIPMLDTVNKLLGLVPRYLG